VAIEQKYKLMKKHADQGVNAVSPSQYPSTLYYLDYFFSIDRSIHEFVGNIRPKNGTGESTAHGVADQQRREL
jgi:hypothetical protein